MVGLELDEWQIEGLRDALGVRPDGRWSASEVAWVVPRQNGKNVGVLVAELLWLFACEDNLITHSAHVFPTAKEHFLEIRRLIEETPALSRKLKPHGIRVGSADLSVELKDGSRLKFMARAKSSGRGLSGDKVVLDEALWLWDDSLASILPALSARPNSQIWYTSSSPIDGGQSDVLRRICVRGRSGGSTSLAYLEFSADLDADLDDRDAWAAANPSLGKHLRWEAVEVERASFTDSHFAQERLGIWHEDTTAAGVNDMTKYRAGAHTLVDGEQWLSDPVCFGVEGNAAGTEFSVVAAGHAAERIGIELVRQDFGTDWVLPWAIGVNDRQKPKGWVFDPKSSTADLFMADFKAAGLNVIECGFPDRALPRATAGMFDDLHNGRLEPLCHPALDAAVEGATWRWVGESRLWDRKSGVQIAPLIAATLARFGLLEAEEIAPQPFAIYT